MAPKTGAGKAHAEAWIDAVDNEWGLEPADRESMLGVVAAIEAEAVADALTALRERVAGLGWTNDSDGWYCIECYTTSKPNGHLAHCPYTAVLAEIDRRMTP